MKLHNIHLLPRLLSVPLVTAFVKSCTRALAKHNNKKTRSQCATW